MPDEKDYNQTVMDQIFPASCAKDEEAEERRENAIWQELAVTDGRSPISDRVEKRLCGIIQFTARNRFDECEIGRMLKEVVREEVYESMMEGEWDDI
jgi:hypothetical protein